MNSNGKYQQKFNSSPETKDRLEKSENSQRSLDENSNLDGDNDLYIAEIDGEFVTVNYQSHLQEPVIAPLGTTTSSQEKHNKVNVTSDDSGGEILSSSTANQKESAKLFSGKKGLLIGIGLGILLAGGINYLITPKSAPKTATTPTTEVSKSATSARAVTVTTVQTTPVEKVLDASGTVAAYEEIPVMSQATGLQVKAILVDRGDVVNRGQILAQLDRKKLQAEKIQAQAAIAQSQARLEELQAGTRTEEIAQAQQRVNSIEAELAQAQ